jgi:bifunctional non-homologous end joining protein LigD
MSTQLVHFIQPMLAKEAKVPFFDDHWLFETKWDGYRAIAELKGDNVLLYSASGAVFNDRYPHLVEALRGLNLQAVLDGQIETGDPDTLPRYHVFDILYKDQHRLEDQPLLWRKQLLKQVVRSGPYIRYSEHVRGEGIVLFQKTLQEHAKGIMGKKADSPYREGVRTSDWLKIINRLTEKQPSSKANDYAQNKKR